MNKYSHVYILCPPNSITGGPDALHQMAYYLNRIGVRSSIAYISYLAKRVEIPEPYKRYISSYELDSDIVDKNDNAVVIPETYSYLVDRYKQATVFIWWLSVDNNRIKYNLIKKVLLSLAFPFNYVRSLFNHDHLFLERFKNRMLIRHYSFNDESLNINHLCASYYALDTIKSNTKNSVYKCIEPISSLFLEKYEQYKEQIQISERSNVILYNPQKCEDIVRGLQEYCPDLVFSPLKGLTQQELIQKYLTSKLYVDFGPFPGAERIPKEAVLFGCSIITGKRGASNYYGDVPIDDRYKFELDDKNLIVERMRELLDNYPFLNKDFDQYRDVILNLECGFITDLQEIFNS